MTWLRVVHSTPLRAGTASPFCADTARAHGPPALRGAEVCGEVTGTAVAGATHRATLAFAQKGNISVDQQS
jgi:hypothetical protein